MNDDHPAREKVAAKLNVLAGEAVRCGLSGGTPLDAEDVAVPRHPPPGGVSARARDGVPVLYECVNAYRDRERYNLLTVQLVRVGNPPAGWLTLTGAEEDVSGFEKGKTYALTVQVIEGARQV